MKHHRSALAHWGQGTVSADQRSVIPMAQHVPKGVCQVSRFPTVRLATIGVDRLQDDPDEAFHALLLVLRRVAQELVAGRQRGAQCINIHSSPHYWPRRIMRSLSADLPLHRFLLGTPTHRSE